MANDKGQTILQQFLALGEYAMLPAVSIGRVVRSHLDSATEAESDGNDSLAAEHLEFAMFLEANA